MSEGTNKILPRILIVDDVETNRIILRNIIRTAGDIGFKTLCEGIETKEQEEAVIKAGADFLQGFYYYRPMPVAQLEKVFNENSGGV